MSNVLKIISRGVRLSDGWGFPPVVQRNFRSASKRPEAIRLRRLLFPTTESEMQDQLVRWYYSMLRSRPHIWRSLEGKYESYEPCGVYKPVIETDGFKVCADPITGFLRVGWVHAGETRGLNGTLEITGNHSALLSFEGWSGTVAMSATDGTAVQKITWPAWMDTHAALIIPEESRVTGARVHLRFRPAGFSTAGIIETILQTESGSLQSAGLLDSFLAAVKPLDKLAVVWLALAILEEEEDMKSLQGNDV